MTFAWGGGNYAGPGQPIRFTPAGVLGLITAGVVRVRVAVVGVFSGANRRAIALPIRRVPLAAASYVMSTLLTGTGKRFRTIKALPIIHGMEGI